MIGVQARPCRTCGASVYDLRHETTGRFGVIEAEPVLLGNIVIDLDAGSYRLAGTDVNPPSPLGSRWQSHFRSCPQGKRA